MGKHIEIDTAVFLLGCIFLLTVPLNWFFAAIFAAAVHELFHAAAIRITGGQIYHFRIGVLGAVMETNLPGRKEEIVCAMAGPCGSFLLLILCHSFPRAALCGLVQGAYNLLPVYPLDGGRILFCILQGCCPKHAEQIVNAVEFLTAGVLVTVTSFASFTQPLGLLPFFAAVFLLGKMRLRKRPCKQWKIRVQ